MPSDFSAFDWEPDIRTLRFFVTVAEEKSITRGPTRLNIVQPALSRKIANLEQDLKPSLYDRSVRRVDLTPAGKILLDRVYAVFGQPAQTFYDVTANTDKAIGTIFLGIPPRPEELIAPCLLVKIKRDDPGIELQFREGFSRELEDWRLTGNIGLAVMHNPPARPDLIRRDLLVATLHLIGATGSLPSRSPPLREAAALPPLMPSRSNDLRVLADQHAETVGTSLNVVQRVDGTRHLKALVRDGQGFTLPTYDGVLTKCNPGTLTAAPIIEPQVEWRTVPAPILAIGSPISRKERTTPGRSRPSGSRTNSAGASAASRKSTSSGAARLRRTAKSQRRRPPARAALAMSSPPTSPIYGRSATPSAFSSRNRWTA